MFEMEKVISNPEDVDFVQEIIQKHEVEIQELLSNEEKHLGDGRTAMVYRLQNENICLKIYRKPEDIQDVDFYLSPTKEQGFQDQLRNITSKARVPKVYACYENTDGTSFLMMEALSAVTVDDILEGKEELPENFNITQFYSDLEDFIEKMHKYEGVYHRDLHEGNIMIGKEKGEAFVIDFGAAVKFKGHFERGERGPYHLRKDGRDIILTSDEAMLRKVIAKLTQHLTKQR